MVPTNRSFGYFSSTTTGSPSTLHRFVLPPRSWVSTPMQPPLSLEARLAGNIRWSVDGGCWLDRIRQCPSGFCVSASGGGRVGRAWSRSGGSAVGEYPRDRVVFGLRHPQAIGG